MRVIPVLSCCLATLLSSMIGSAQTQSPPRGVPEAVPPLLRSHPSVPEPVSPAARSFHDGRYGVSFVVPAAWNLNRKDFEVSTFHLDARSAAANAQLRAVASISFNPHPASTFSGALFYFSVAPRTSGNVCAAEATVRAPRNAGGVSVAGLNFNHGYDEHGGICTESRDEIYTLSRNNTCYRFDSVINTFCGGDVSGIRDITESELNSVRQRLQAILASVRFDSEQ